MMITLDTLNNLTRAFKVVLVDPHDPLLFTYGTTGTS